MDYLIGLNLISAGELALIAVAVYSVTQIIKVSKIPLANKYLPFISIVAGIFFGLFIGIMQHDSNIMNTVFAGFLVGASTTGIFTGIKGVAGGYDQKGEI
ncbi:holin [Companilactobacillus mishanensis]|uniref:Holin n=1 Tax=Companilactobacillus mishanensis TaxID=2486008 RepID=A0A5P0ZF41_9LACO|nr:holin [Companilactobacillus mishanensis]MQS44232.1 hypothetical protein [Companilactobacillus mishanensis]MQS51663.1 hypothetical protein [Companilactobacillus mishanensis]